MTSDKKNEKADYLKDENPRQGFRATESTTSDSDEDAGEENAPTVPKKGSDAPKTPLESHPPKH